MANTKHKPDNSRMYNLVWDKNTRFYRVQTEKRYPPLSSVVRSVPVSRKNVPPTSFL
jgi:hypothetical protein